jgi:divinyl protochlorophyllide a 8-vinyl-reductase
MRSLALEAAREAGDRSRDAVARIGPNAIIQLGDAIVAKLGAAARRDLFHAAGLGRYLTALPTSMVDEKEVIALHRALRSSLPSHHYRAIAWDAGLRTGDYILAHRIPRLAQRLLRRLPASLAAKALTLAIAKHSWTFAGSGNFRARSTRPLVLEIEASPLCRGEYASTPLCDYYAGTFTRLYGTLVDPRLTFGETTCACVAGTLCRFEAATLGRPGHPAS